ncbi:MAG: DASS family sodium-coupled anion symporter [Deltaproteobacteria bacterium]|nr:DASS family sodium-coupled anion symporter [Deltaproteobacteria bacterium]
MPREVEVDRRPLWIIVLMRGRRLLLLAVGALLYWLTLQLGHQDGLSPAGLKALAVFVLCIFYWVLNVLPTMITSLLAIVLLPLTGVLTSRDAYALFGNEAVFFILGAFILAAAMMKAGLSTRLALAILRRFGGKPPALLGGVFLINGAMSLVMSEHAVAAMTFPIIVEIAGVLRLTRGRSQYARALFLAMAWGTTIGGVATLLGGARAPLALGILREVSGQTISFAEWSAATAPLVLLLFVVGWLLLRLFFAIDVSDVSAAQHAVEEKLLAMGRASFQERLTGGVMALTIAAWIVLGEEFGLANIALVAVVVLFGLNLVQWRDIERYVNWGLILMYGGAICLGSALNRSGASTWLADHIISQWASGPTSVMFLVSAAAILLTEVMSNSAAVAIVMPVSLAIAAQFNMEPRIMALVVAVPAGLAFTLPIGTPANAIAYSSGFLRTRDMFVPGLVLTSISLLLFNLLASWYWPLLGITP